MSANAIVDEAVAAGIDLFLKEGRLFWRGRTSAMGPHLRDAIASNKGEVIAFLLTAPRRPPQSAKDQVLRKRVFGDERGSLADSRLAILTRCPDVFVGDIWRNVWQWPKAVHVFVNGKWDERYEDPETVCILGFVAPDEGLPWPQVRVLPRDGVEETIGLPAFLCIGERPPELVERGTGPGWRQP